MVKYCAASARSSEESSFTVSEQCERYQSVGEKESGAHAKKVSRLIRSSLTVPYKLAVKDFRGFFGTHAVVRYKKKFNQ